MCIEKIVETVKLKESKVVEYVKKLHTRNCPVGYLNVQLLLQIHKNFQYCCGFNSKWRILLQKNRMGSKKIRKEREN